MPYKVFISYSHKDQALRQKLDTHLSNLKRQDIISSWYDGDILPGTEWQPQIMEQLNTADIILLLISANFMASDFCYSIEMLEAVARHDAHQAYVIPIILRSTDWKGAPFAKLKMLPTDAKPVTKWPSRDDAFLDVVEGIKRILAATPLNHPATVVAPLASTNPPTPTTASVAPTNPPATTVSSTPTQPLPSAVTIPAFGKHFLTNQDRSWLISSVNTIIDDMSKAAIKNLLRGKLPDAQIERISYNGNLRNVAENIIGMLEPRGVLSPPRQHYHALGAFLNDLIDSDDNSLGYDATVQIVELLFTYTLITDKPRITALSAQFQVRGK